MKINGNGDGHLPVPSHNGSRGGSLPPHNIEAEEGLLGSILLDPAVMANVVSIVSPEDFYRAAHESLAVILWARFATGQTIDPMLVDEDLRKVRGFGASETTLFIGSLIDKTPHPANTVYYAQIVRQKAIARGLIEAGNRILHDGYSCQFTSEELLARAESEVMAISGRLVSGDATHSVAEVADVAMDRLELRGSGERGGVITGFCDLDDILGCLRDANLAVLAARPAMGKTAIAMNIAHHVAAVQGISTLFFSLEMEHGDLGERLLSALSGVHGKKFQDPSRLEGADKRAIGAARSAMEHIPLAIDDCPVRTVAQIGAVARLRQKRAGLGFILIDYLSLIDGQPRRGESRQEEVARMARDLKALARTLNVPILLLCQLNRELEKRGDGKPRLADLRESGQIEQEASVVLLLHRSCDSPGEADLIVAKNRFGRTGAVRLAFRRECTKFENLALGQFREQSEEEF